MAKNIVVINGDGIGAEIIAEAIKVCKVAAQKANLTLNFTKCLAGGEAIDVHGVPLPEETIKACKEADATLLGAVGGPKWDNVVPHLRPEKAILNIRKELNLYANLRPVKLFKPLIDQSPLKNHIINDVDMMIVRELNGGIYYGKRKEIYDDNGVKTAWDTEIYNEQEITKIMHMAFNIARKRKSKVTSVDKANVLASSRLWRQTCEKIATEYNDVHLNHLYIDNCAMQVVLAPKAFDVIVTNNIFGDILSDEAAVITGSIGTLASASLGDGPGLYEPIHGSAPDIAGQGIANPIGTILSAAMMFRYSLNELGIAEKIEKAVETALENGYRTKDLYKEGLTLVSTEKMGDMIAQHI